MLTIAELFEIRSQFGDTREDWDYERAIIAAHTAKLRAGVEMPSPFSMEDDQLTYTYDQLQQYGDARDQVGYFRGVANINEELRSEGVYPKWHVDALTEVAEQRGYLRGLDEAHAKCWELAAKYEKAHHPTCEAVADECAEAIDKLKGGE